MTEISPDAQPPSQGAPRVVVGSGWWSSDGDFKKEFPNRKELGDAIIRSVPFFDLWLESVEAATEASEIVVVDSAAPLKPSKEMRDRVRWIELPFNARHSTNHIGPWSGWMRSVLVSGSYAMSSDCDFFAYVEQDCLLKGDGFVTACIAEMTADHMYGSGVGTPQPLQQSFFIVRGSALPRFLANLSLLKDRDGDMGPEWKFVWASSTVLTRLANTGLFNFKLTRKLGFRIAKLMGVFCFLPFGTGRVRPVPFGDGHYYFQHGTSEEIARYRKDA